VVGRKSKRFFVGVDRSTQLARTEMSIAALFPVGGAAAVV